VYQNDLLGVLVAGVSSNPSWGRYNNMGLLISMLWASVLPLYVGYPITTPV
jgi:hypothetical protein